MYLLEKEELDRRYQQGYETVPEEPEAGEVQVAMPVKLSPRESW